MSATVRPYELTKGSAFYCCETRRAVLDQGTQNAWVSLFCIKARENSVDNFSRHAFYLEIRHQVAEFLFYFTRKQWEMFQLTVRRYPVTDLVDFIIVDTSTSCTTI